ncbi:hypothetical protein EDD98_6512 [Streptomyces sp. PanSC19]|nr:hypothetical protein EDD98_6512 [Streptomyces sp. PanSC19]
MHLCSCRQPSAAPSWRPWTSELLVIGCDGLAAAEKAFGTAQELRRDHVVRLNGLAVVSIRPASAS